MVKKLLEFKNINRFEWTKENTADFCHYLKQAFWCDEVNTKKLSNMNIGDMMDIVWSHVSSIDEERFEEEFYDLAMQILTEIEPLT